MAKIKRYTGTGWVEVLDGKALGSANTARPTNINTTQWHEPNGYGQGGYLEYVTAFHDATGVPSAEASSDNCLLNFGWDNGSWGSQMLVCSSEAAEECRVYVRNNYDNIAGKYSDWKRLAFASEVPTVYDWAKKSDLSGAINTLSTGSSTPTDGDYYVCQYAGGGTSVTTYHRRPHSALWSYINGKASSVYAKQSDMSTALSAKQDKLTITGATYLNGSNIETETEESKKGIYSKKAVDSLFVKQSDLRIATEEVAGLVKLGSGTISTLTPQSVTAMTARTYLIQRNGSGQLVVNVPWVETDTRVATTTIYGYVYMTQASLLDCTGYSTHGYWRDPNTDVVVCYGTTGSISGSGNKITFKYSFKGAPTITVTPFFKSTSETSIGTQYRNAATVRCYIVNGSLSASYSSSSTVTGFVLDTGNTESQYFNYVAIGRVK